MSVVVYNFISGSSTRDQTEHQTFISFTARILEAINPTASVCILALLLVKRLSDTTQLIGAKGFELRILLTALIISDSVLNDNAFDNTSWTALSGISGKELSLLKFDFLDRIGYRTYCSRERFQGWIFDLEYYLRHSVFPCSYRFQKVVDGVQGVLSSRVRLLR